MQFSNFRKEKMIEKVLKNFPTTLYIAKIKINNDSLEIIDFKLLNHGKNTNYSKEEFTSELIKKSIDSNYFKKFAKIIKEKNNKLEIKYQFKDKTGKIYTFKDTLKIIDKKDNIYTLLGLGINISKEEELSQIFESIIDSNHMGIIIYKEKIVFCDNYAKNVLQSENYDLSPINLFPDNMKPLIKDTIQKRLNGKKFSKFYALELPSLKNNRKFVEFYTHTIIYEGEYAGLIILIDKTQFFKHKKMLEIIQNVNSTILTQTFDKQKLLTEIVSQIKSVSYFKDVFISNKKIKNNQFYNLQINDEFLVFEAKYKDDFDELCINTLKKIQKNIQKAIKEINKNLTLIILKQALEQSFQWLLITDENGKIIYVNDAVTKISGYSKEELIGKNPKIFKSEKHNESLYKHLWDTILDNKIFETTLKNKNKNNQIFYLKNRILPITLPNEKKYFVSMGIDITHQKRLEKKITNIKLKDKITELYNRYGFINESKALLNPHKKFALIVIDIKDFKAINAIKGNKFGNEILQQFSIFLQIFFHKNSIISRIGNDEFAIFTEIKNIDEIKDKLNTFMKVIKKIEILSLKLSINIGIAIFPDDDSNIENLIEKALIALENAKNNGEFSIEFYNKTLDTHLKNNIQIKTLIHQAIKEDKFIYHYQPYISTKDFNISSAECLIRIQHNNNLIYPSEFINFAESSGLIKDIEILMAKKIINILKTTPIPLSFNISANSLNDDEHLSKLIKLTKEYANKIIIEITERELIFNTKKIIQTLQEFKNLGFKIAIDDFGTGYSSFMYIKNLPIDYLKIDSSFTKNIEKCKKDLAIVEAIINISKKLDIKTIAEGIETKKQMEILTNLGCDYLQGYYFFKPMGFEELIQNLKNPLDN